jgi:predicted kinase
MSKFICAIGISGCGKTTFGNTLKKENSNLEIVCPDDIRKELTGDISDQTQNEKVWNICYSRIIHNLQDGKDVYLSATNLSKGGLKHLFKLAEKASAEIEIVAFEDSRDWELCYNRVKKDIDNGIDRSNSLVNITVDNAEVPLIKQMSDRYIALMDSRLLESQNIKVTRV